MEIKLNKLGLILVTFGTFTFLFANIDFFVIDDATTRCIAYSVVQEPINKDQLMKCSTDGHDARMYMLIIGVTTGIIILFGNVTVELSHKNQISITTETNTWSNPFRAKGYR